MKRNLFFTLVLVSIVLLLPGCSEMRTERRYDWFESQQIVNSIFEREQRGEIKLTPRQIHTLNTVGYDNPTEDDIDDVLSNPKYR